MGDSGFKENQARDVKISCKKVVMEKILGYLYGGEVTLDGLSLKEAVELLDMLRQMVLEDAFKLAESELIEKIKYEDFNLADCLNTVDFVFAIKLQRTFFSLMDYIWSHLHIVSEEHGEHVVDKSFLEKFASYFSDGEFKPNYESLGPLHIIHELNFFSRCQERHGNPSLKAILQQKIQSVDLKTFEVEELLGCIKKSKLFKDEDIDAAVLQIHERERCYHYHDHD